MSLHLKTGASGISLSPAFAFNTRENRDGRGMPIQKRTV
ncbi:hypothetical protein AB434_2473 [Heyndrickxia coagulans]|uniref:Uncharacterized protein n=1 Tax=Heyndrickxia coagulans TaxID=1398 RepID=A0AAN0WCZ5_HEYCO|nr:hypothetical protein SB48_HM08orf04516 [Heyndrickxia coagulans]AKN54878.1 hypothetical protein AB434_2473 [Heyndrickxia coagulans]